MSKRSIDRIHAYNIVTPALLGYVLGTQQLCGTQNGTHNVISSTIVDVAKISKWRYFEQSRIQNLKAFFRGLNLIFEVRNRENSSKSSKRPARLSKKWFFQNFEKVEFHRFWPIFSVKNAQYHKYGKIRYLSGDVFYSIGISAYVGYASVITLC